MRKIYLFIAIFAAFIGITAAHADGAPKYLQGGTITVTLKDGKTFKYSTDEYMVVKRGSGQKAAVGPQRPAKQAPAEPVAAGPNSFTAFGGAGPSGVKVTQNPTSVTIEQDYGAIFGFGYRRQLNKRFSLEAVGLSNKTGLLGVGASF